MNISEAKRILNSASIIKEIRISREQKGALTTVMFSGLRSFMKGLNHLTPMDIFLSLVDDIINDPFYFSLLRKQVDDNIRVNDDELARHFTSKVSSLLQQYDIVYRAINTLSPPDAGENSISIKMSKVRDLDDLYKTAQDFNIIFSQLILNEKIGGSLEIKNVENGSVWLDVFVGTPLAVSVIGSLTWAAAVVYKKIQEGKIIEEHVKSLKIKNESLTDLMMAQKELLKSTVEIEARNIETQYFSDGNNEQLGRIKNSISLLATQIEKGSEVHPYLNAPEDVKNLFPDMKKLPQIESKIPRLSE